MELVSLLGNLAVFEGGWMVHAQALVGKSDGSVLGGHVMGAIVHPRAEVILQAPAGGLQRLRDPQTGLAGLMCEVWVIVIEWQESSEFDKT